MTLRIVLAIPAFFIAFAPPLQAAPNPLEILKMYERRYSDYQGLKMKMKLLVGRPGAMKLTAKFKLRTRPNGQRITRLTFPGDVKGMMMLVQSRQEMYIYLPAYRKVRRLAGHVRNQGFLGSGFTYDDLAIDKYSRDFKVRLTKETDKLYWLDLRAIPGRPALYKHVKMSIRKDNGFAETLQYVSRLGKTYKTQRFLNYSCYSKSKHCNPNLIRMIEHTRGNRRSDMITQKIKYSRGFKNRMFTVRYLMRAAN